ncbi:MAG: hypothetical protein Q4B08_12920 [Propionibacteriaceae bacterium]|nr:hypothetical protein [Propionibacteriaceae bacterium]
MMTAWSPHSAAATARPPFSDPAPSLKEDAATLDLYALDTPVQLHLTGERVGEFASQLRALWARCIPGGTPSLEPSAIHWDTGEDTRPVGEQPELTRQITLALIKTQVGKLLMLHAGAVCHPDTGEAIAYAAAGGTGKTTLTRLLASRMGYLTDETVGLRADGSIAAYPKPLSVRTGPHDKREYSPDELGLIGAHPKPRLHRLALLCRDGGPLRVERVSLTEAVLALAPETSSMDRLPRPLHWLARLYDDLGGVVRYRYGEASDVASHIWEEFGC